MSAVCALRDVITPRRYFEVIVDLMERMPEDSKPDYIFLPYMRASRVWEGE